jgi:hypothetical protein
MRLLLIVGLLAMIGCATAPRPGTMEWNTVAPHADGASEPVVKDGGLVLSGSAIRSRATYAAPVTLVCELQSLQPSSIGNFYIDFVPNGVSAVPLPQEFVGIKLNNNNILEVWASSSNHPARLIESTVLPIVAEGQYKLVLEVQHVGFNAHTNGVPMTIDIPVPYNRFQIELRAFPPPSHWLVRDFSIR